MGLMMTLFCYRGRITLDEAELSDAFLPLRDRLEALILGTYFAQLCEALTPGCIPDYLKDGAIDRRVRVIDITVEYVSGKFNPG